MPNGHSVTEYVKHRFGTLPFVAISVVIIFVMGIFITAEMTAITAAVSILTGSPAWATAVAVGVVVVAYTAYGGLRVSIYTDRIQFWVLIPVLLLLVIVAAALIGGSGVWGAAKEAGLLSVSSSGSYFFGIVLIIGIVASNAFHPGMWQRVYTVESQRGPQPEPVGSDRVGHTDYVSDGYGWHRCGGKRFGWGRSSILPLRRLCSRWHPTYSRFGCTS